MYRTILRSNTPGLLFTVAFALYTIAPAAVYFIPDDSTALIVAQVTSEREALSRSLQACEHPTWNRS